MGCDNCKMKTVCNMKFQAICTNDQLQCRVKEYIYNLPDYRVCGNCKHYEVWQDAWEMFTDCQCMESKKYQEYVETHQLPCEHWEFNRN
jgi:hypothetical protein